MGHQRRLVFFLTASFLACPDLSAMDLGRAELDLELDAYYSDLALYVPFTRKAVEEKVEKGEWGTYQDMLRKALIPRYMVLEASINPLPVLGAFIRKQSETFYQRAQWTDNMNVIEAVTAGFEEPYALSLFLGKVIDFDPGKKRLRRSKKGYVGYLASAGNYHLMDSLLIADNWLELEAKIKGDQEIEHRKMSWSFRGGGKFHHHREILDTYYIGIRRSRTDFKKSRFSFLLSSGIDYRVDFDQRTFKPIRHFFLLEKNFPLAKRKWTFSIGIGYLFQGQDKYSGSLAARRRKGESQILIRPNLKF